MSKSPGFRGFRRKCCGSLAVISGSRCSPHCVPRNYEYSQWTGDRRATATAYVLPSILSNFDIRRLLTRIIPTNAASRSIDSNAYSSITMKSRLKVVDCTDLRGLVISPFVAPKNYARTGKLFTILARLPTGISRGGNLMGHIRL
ncbi:hypothetical protein JVT61DRAFT_14184 [Boletus reticuloceps]|uniref:Uncharacterized protein n=1 Tax=Boletus reticuloceps TaxID=495285 RepID=A0A8I2YCW3_9AGAM|nr:hypothetical protein JVT61DRAFT_14184 [Boletus reticuloceps]